ncbi:MAG TPA: hypothetical protein VIH59_36010 [Candidatus Tectomicrobia bacterium]|jgi:hypothetical protein
MQLTITTIIFGLPTGQRVLHTRLTLPVPTLPVRELIAHKVRQEVAEYLAHQRSGLSGEYLAPELLVRAAPAAFVPGAVDAEIARAQGAFTARDYMIVVDNRRVFDAEELVVLCPETQIEFIKILPLVGG